MNKIQPFIVQDKNIFIGLEDSKRSWKLCVRADRMTIHETSMPAIYENLRSYLTNRYPGCTVQVMYESGFSGFWLHDLLTEDAFECIVTPASRVTMEKVNAVKTDKRDARRLAKNLENGDYVRCFVPDKELREDRSISRVLGQVQRDITRKKNQIRKFLDFYGLNDGRKAGAWYDSDYEKLSEIQLESSLKISLSMLLKSLQFFAAQKKELLKALDILSKKDRYKRAVELKRSIPGIGSLTSIRLTLEWGGLRRFPTGKHLASFAGLTSCEFSTGDTVRRGRITSQGSDSVRSWLIQCAWMAVKKDPVLLGKFDRVWKNSGSKKKAIVAVARKLAVRIRAIEWADMKYCIGVIE